jgi:hypothetical protein
MKRIDKSSWRQPLKMPQKGFSPRRRLLGTPTYTVVSYERDFEEVW